MPLSATMQQRLASNQFVTPTPVQAEAIPHALAGKDVLATAQTGTGKTLAFLVPAIEGLLQSKSKGVEVLVLVPTRELAMQVAEQYDQIRGKLKPAALVIGGLSENPQIQALRSGASMVVATPGRLEDFLERRLVSLRNVRTLVLDEADRMLDMGFLPAIRRIVEVLPTQRQTLCFSATLEASVAGLVHDYMRSPVRVSLGSTLKPAENVELRAFEVSLAGKGEALRHILSQEKGRCLIFSRTKRGTERLAKSLARDGFSVGMLHGDRTQSQRTKALEAFDSGRCQILVATDVASRGLHVTDVAHVINYDLPELPEDFIHRVGRTGRAGARGVASSLVCGTDIAKLVRIERTLKLRIERHRISDGNGERTMRPNRNSLSSRTLTAMPGEMFA